MNEPRIRYSQSAGTYDLITYDENGDEKTPQRLGSGWAGHGDGKNNPSMQHVVSVGPLPRGLYDIGEPFNHPHCGPFSMRLTPCGGQDMLGREGFLIHGPAMSAERHGQESNGCEIAERVLRQRIWASGARLNEVVS